MKQIPVVAVVGPTATGKSRLAVELALHFGGEIISSDSMQIYKGMEIGTAQPNEAERKGVPHHLIGFADPQQSFSVADYVQLAADCITRISGCGKLPILAGGTGLYISSLLYGIRFSPEGRDEKLRASLYRKAETEGGKQALLEELRGFDPESAARIHPNNTPRVVRAIEIYRVTGITMTEQLRGSREAPSRYDACVIGLNYRDRGKLYEAIDRRVDEMVKSGLPEEAKRVLTLREASTALQAIGYKEFGPYFSGKCSLADAVERVKLVSRHYAKRQLTWFRRMENVRWIMLDDYPDFASVCREAARILDERRAAK